MKCVNSNCTRDACLIVAYKFQIQLGLYSDSRYFKCNTHFIPSWHHIILDGREMDLTEFEMLVETGELLDA